MSTVLHTFLAPTFVALVACSGDETALTDRTGNELWVSLLTPGPISDQSWNGGAYAGLEMIRDSLGPRVSPVRTSSSPEVEENVRHYGAQAYDLVLGHGFQYQDAAERVAPEFPASLYVTTSGNRTGNNLAGVSFGSEEPSYLSGMVGGAMSRSGVISVIGGTNLPPVRASFVAFEAGARSVRPSVRVLTSYIGSWDDVSAGKEQALARIGRGADVIFQNADATGLGVFQAAKERAVYATGSNSDQNAVAPEVVLGSVLIDLPRAFLLHAREVRDSSFAPRVVALGTPEDVVRWVVNPALHSRIPASVQTRVDSVRAEIAAGRFVPPGAELAFPTRGDASPAQPAATASPATAPGGGAP